MSDSDTICVGIDFGAKRSFVGAWKDGVQVLVCELEEQNVHLPTYVNFSDNRIQVGTAAELNTRKDCTISFVKQLLGQKFNSSKDITGLPNGHLPPIISNNEPCFKISGRNITPSQAFVEILKHLKAIVVQQLGQKHYIKAVITVPAEATQEYRLTIKSNAEKVFTDVAIISEPTATALAYMDQLEIDDGQHIVVVDVGSSNTQMSISTLRNSSLEVVRNSSNNIGGDNLDDVVVIHILTQWKKLDCDDTFRSNVRQAWLEAMPKLQHETQTTIKVGTDQITLTRDQFTSLNGDNLNNIIDAIRNMMDKEDKSGSFDMEDIHWIALVGGYSRVPGLVAAIEAYFNTKIIDESVSFLLAKKVYIQLIYATDSLLISVRLDQVTVYGATREANRLFGINEEDEPVVVEIAGRNIGLQTFGGVMTPFITQDLPVPTESITKLVSTSRDGQTSIVIKIYEGNQPLARQNKLLGTFNLTKIPAKPKGVPKIRVSFDMDRDGILVVKAEDVTHGFQNQIRITKG